jgi:hypothetical protein
MIGQRDDDERKREGKTGQSRAGQGRAGQDRVEAVVSGEWWSGGGW